MTEPLTLNFSNWDNTKEQHIVTSLLNSVTFALTKQYNV